MRNRRWLCALLAFGLLLSGCGGEGAPKGNAAPLTRSESVEFIPYAAPPFASSQYHEDLAEGDGVSFVDLSAVSEGYVAVSVSSAKRLKFQVLKDDATYNYDIASDGTPSVLPLQCGDGHYVFRVMENIEGSKYAQIYLTECDVTLLDEFQPFLRPSDYSNYAPDSACVKKAAELAAECGSALEVVSAVYDYICRTVVYDREKAATVQSGYLPVPDETMLTGKGICFDYASLAAAMLRSQGIPTKVIFGYVSPNDLYHAWNMFYTEESGWVTVKFEVSADTWTRMDLTFSAGGAPDEFVGDGSNYADLYSY